MDPDEFLHSETPIVSRPELSSFIGAGVQVFLKLDNLQPTRSFKQRGIGLFCSRAVRHHGVSHFISSSSGNAGLAAAYSARRLGARCTVVIPESTPSIMRDLMEAQGAEVKVHGKAWPDANVLAESLVGQEGDGACLVHPFDHADVWRGHSTIVDEVAIQMPDPPDVVVLAVGGGGLLNGVVEGLQRHGWLDTTVVAMETIGADCLNRACQEGCIVTLPVTSIAKSLGASRVSARSWDLVLRGRFNILSAVVSDAEAVNAVEKFANDLGMLVEPACGAALAAIYSGVLSRLVAKGKLCQPRSVLVLVCGGRSATPDLLRQWKEQVKSPDDSTTVSEENAR